MATPKSNEQLELDIQYIKDDIKEIKKKLDEKYVSHETFDLIIKNVHDLIAANKKYAEDADSRIIKTALYFATPLYAGVITAILKLFF